MLDFRPDFQDVLLSALHELQAIHSIANLRFDHEHDGIVAQSGVGPEKHEEIGEAADGDAEIGAHALSPGVVNFHAALPHHAAPNERLGGAEAGAINQNVRRALGPILGDDAMLAHLGDGFGDEFYIRAVERRIEIIGNENALATELIIGRQRGEQLGILDRPREMTERNGLDLLAKSVVAEKAEDAKLLTPENILPQGPARDGNASKAALPVLTEGKIEPRHDPSRRALEKMELPGAWRALRDDLDGAGAGANDGDIFSGEVHAVIPGGGMKLGSRKALEARQFRVARDVQRAHAGDKHASANAHFVSCRCVPDSFGFIPNGISKAGVEAQIRSKPVMLNAALQVVVDFLLARIHARPIGRRFEREGIEMRRDVAGAAGITIVPPGAADIFALFDDEKGAETGFNKLDAHANPGKPGADDQDVDIRDGRVCRRSCGFGHARAILLSSAIDPAGAV